VGEDDSSATRQPTDPSFQFQLLYLSRTPFPSPPLGQPRSSPPSPPSSICISSLPVPLLSKTALRPIYTRAPTHTPRHREVRAQYQFSRLSRNRFFFVAVEGARLQEPDFHCYVQGFCCRGFFFVRRKTGFFFVQTRPTALFLSPAW
jgi:hypothetical protein